MWSGLARPGMWYVSHWQKADIGLIVHKRGVGVTMHVYWGCIRGTRSLTISLLVELSAIKKTGAASAESAVAETEVRRVSMVWTMATTTATVLIVAHTRTARVVLNVGDRPLAPF